MYLVNFRVMASPPSVRIQTVSVSSLNVGDVYRRCGKRKWRYVMFVFDVDPVYTHVVHSCTPGDCDTFTSDEYVDRQILDYVRQPVSGSLGF